MELEFDKEIDALIRGRGALVGDSPPKGHLDADEIAAFAENAMPQRARALHMAHVADCDRCRGILSNLIALNAEAEPEKAAAAADVFVPAETPWYSKLLLFPNLAYVMGGLVLVMGGLISVSIYNGTAGGDVAVSQMTETEAVRGPMAATDSIAANTAANVSAASNAAVANANTAAASQPPSGSAANPVSNAAAASPTGDVAAAEPAPKPADVAVTRSLSATEQPAAAAPVPAPPPPMEEAEASKDDNRQREISDADREKKKAAAPAARKEVSRDGADLALRSQAGGPAKAKPGPTRDSQQTFPNRADNTYALRSRRVNGKDFEYRSGAWYDTEYRSQATTNVRRGTEEYKKLDGGLRSIAETLSGVVVTVWGGKAYRIQ